MTRDQRHNATCNVVGEALWGFQGAMVLSSTVLTVLLTKFGAARTTLGLIPMLEGATLLLQLIGVYLFRCHRTRKWRIVLWHYFGMIPFLGLLGLAIFGRAHFAPPVLVVVLLLCWVLFCGAVGVAGAAWQDWVAHLFEARFRGTVTGLAWGFSSLAGVAGTLCAGALLRRYPQTDTYGWLYIAAMVVATLSITVFAVVRDPAEHQDSVPGASLPQILAAARQSLADANFRAILVGRSLAAAGFCIGPFIAVHYLSSAGGALPEATIISLGAAQTAGATVTCILFGRLGDRLGHRFGVLAGTVFQVASLVSLLLIPKATGCLMAYLFAGCVGGILIVSYTNLVIDSCPHGVRSAHLVVGNLVVGLVLLLAPLVSSQIAEHRGIPTLVVFSLVVSLGSVLWIAVRVREPRRVRPSGSRG
jgi:MFS family permease